MPIKCEWLSKLCYTMGCDQCTQRQRAKAVFVASWTAAGQAPLSVEFFRQRYWSGLPFPTLGHLPDPGIKPASLVSPALPGGFFTTSATWEAHTMGNNLVIKRDKLLIYAVARIYAKWKKPDQEKIGVYCTIYFLFYLYKTQENTNSSPVTEGRWVAV